MQNKMKCQRKYGVHEMNNSVIGLRTALLIAGLGMIGFGAIARADIGPPAAIKLAPDANIAVSSQAYDGAFEIRIGKSGDVSDFRFEGEGWQIITSTLPTSSFQADIGTIYVTFRAIPTNADNPLGMSFRFNGRRVKALFEVGPEYAEKKETRALTRIPNTTGWKSVEGGEPPGCNEATTQAAGGAIPIRAVGRVVYTRAGRDLSNPPDGDFDDFGETPPMTVGGVGLTVQFLDQDLTGVETIWSGQTDDQGYFDSGVIMWDDCDILGCDLPDLVLVVSTSVNTFAVMDLREEVYIFGV